MKPYKVCPPWLKIVYRTAVDFKCQRCNRHEDIVGVLTPHRITRGNKGGLYTVVKLNHPDNNVKVVCNECHGLFHANDNRRVRSQ